MLHLKAKYKVSTHKAVKLYTIRHYTSQAIEAMETDKTVLLKQITPEIVQIITT